MADREWVAYCRECRKEIGRAENGSWVEAAARAHVGPGHTGCKQVIVGYELIAPEARCPDCGERGEIKGHMDCQYPQD